MSSSPNNCHYYELGSYITVCKPGLDLRRKEAGLGTIVSHIGTALLSSRRYANRSPKWYLGVCLRVMGCGRVWTGIRCQASRKSQFVRGVPDDILKRDRSLSFTWRAPSGSHPLASSTANPHVAALLLPLPAASVVGVRVPESAAYGGGAVHYPFYHCWLLLNTANVKVHRRERGGGARPRDHQLSSVQTLRMRPIPGPSPFA